MKIKFKRYEITGLAARPSWWLVRPDEISQMACNLKYGYSRVIARTPGGYPVFAFFYNYEDNELPGVHWSSASSSGNPEKYKSSGYEKQTVIICAGIHGAEAEGVVSLANLVSLLESGRDLKGETRDGLLKLLQQYRVVLLPCVNMDGRAISPDHLRGAAYKEFREASQGLWLSGKYIEWKESKEYFPLPLDKVGFPGGYPNSEGFNIMHDCAPGCLQTEEAEAVLKLTEITQADLFLNLHSCEGSPTLLPPSRFNYREHIRRGDYLYRKLLDVFKEKKLISPDVEAYVSSSQTINLNTAAAMVSGALALTFESTVSDKLTFEQMLEAHYILFEEVLADGLRNKFAPRTQII